MSFIYRATPAYATNYTKLDVSSFIEVYTDGKLSDTPTILDSFKLGSLV